MKIFAAITLLLFPTTLLAQSYGGMKQGDMQNMMKAMQQVQECMAGIDQAQLNELQARSEKFKKKIDEWCAAGKRSKAQKQALNFGKKIAADPVMKQMEKCGEMAQGALPMPGMVETYDQKDYADKHVCDQ
jgi:hypothetical protein